MPYVVQNYSEIGVLQDFILIEKKDKYKRITLFVVTVENCTSASGIFSDSRLYTKSKSINQSKLNFQEVLGE